MKFLLRLKRPETEWTWQLLMLSMTFCIPSISHGQTCDPDAERTRPDSRYTDNSDGTVTDNVTNLMWMQCTEGLTTTTTPCDTGFANPYPLFYATNYLTKINSEKKDAGYSDWRMPSLDELKTLQEATCHSPAINTHLFPNTPSSYFWTSEDYPEASKSAYLVYFDYALLNWDYESGYHYYRLVRENKNSGDKKQ